MLRAYLFTLLSFTVLCASDVQINPSQEIYDKAVAQRKDGHLDAAYLNFSKVVLEAEESELTVKALYNLGYIMNEQGKKINALGWFEKSNQLNQRLFREAFAPAQKIILTLLHAPHTLLSESARKGLIPSNQRIPIGSVTNMIANFFEIENTQCEVTAPFTLTGWTQGKDADNKTIADGTGLRNLEALKDLQDLPLMPMTLHPYKSDEHPGMVRQSYCFFPQVVRRPGEVGGYVIHIDRVLLPQDILQDGIDESWLRRAQEIYFASFVRQDIMLGSQAEVMYMLSQGDERFKFAQVKADSPIERRRKGAAAYTPTELLILRLQDIIRAYNGDIEHAALAAFESLFLSPDANTEIIEEAAAQLLRIPHRMITNFIHSDMVVRLYSLPFNGKDISLHTKYQLLGYLLNNFQNERAYRDGDTRVIEHVLASVKQDTFEPEFSSLYPVEVLNMISSLSSALSGGAYVETFTDDIHTFQSLHESLSVGRPMENTSTDAPAYYFDGIMTHIQGSQTALKGLLGRLTEDATLPLDIKKAWISEVCKNDKALMWLLTGHLHMTSPEASNVRHALESYDHAAAGGNAEALEILANAFKVGEHGIISNPLRAAEFYWRAHMHGSLSPNVRLMVRNMTAHLGAERLAAVKATPPSRINFSTEYRDLGELAAFQHIFDNPVGDAASIDAAPAASAAGPADDSKEESKESEVC